MDRDWLEAQLAAGRSIESIAREIGKHPSTVGYWLKKHGLTSRYAELHGPRGSLERERLAELVKQGLSNREIADAVGRSETTVRYWLRAHDLRTLRAAAAPTPGGGARVIQRDCRIHGRTAWVRSGSSDRYRCKHCRSAAVTARRRRVKRLLIEEAGGRCILCGYDRFPGALHFHHLDPTQKSFALSLQGVTRSLEKARAEAAKCVLMCANCHAEVEGGVATIRL
jgi:DNA-binding transcriptional ArsR family regulator